MNVGEMLNEGHMEMNIDNNELLQSVIMDVLNRNVEGKENIPTQREAGNVIRYSDTKMKIKTVGIRIPEIWMREWLPRDSE